MRTARIVRDTAVTKNGTLYMSYKSGKLHGMVMKAIGDLETGDLSEPEELWALDFIAAALAVDVELDPIARPLFTRICVDGDFPRLVAATS